MGVGTDLSVCVCVSVVVAVSCGQVYHTLGVHPRAPQDI